MIAGSKVRVTNIQERKKTAHYLQRTPAGQVHAGGSDPRDHRSTVTKEIRARRAPRGSSISPRRGPGARTRAGSHLAHG